MVGNLIASFNLKKDKYEVTKNSILTLAIEALFKVSKKGLEEIIGDYDTGLATTINDIDLKYVPCFLLYYGFNNQRIVKVDEAVNTFYTEVLECDKAALDTVDYYLDSIVVTHLVNMICNKATRDELVSYVNLNSSKLNSDTIAAINCYFEAESFDDCMLKLKDNSSSYIKGIALTLCEVTYPYLDRKYITAIESSGIFNTTATKTVTSRSSEKDFYYYLSDRDILFVNLNNITDDNEISLKDNNDKYYLLLTTEGLFDEDHYGILSSND